MRGRMWDVLNKRFSELLLLLSHFSRVRLCVAPQMAAHQAPPSLGFSRQEHCLSYMCISLLARVCAFCYKNVSDLSHYSTSQPTWEAIASHIDSFGFGGLGGLRDKRKNYWIREQSLFCSVLWSFWAPCGREGGHCFLRGDYPSYQEGISFMLLSGSRVAGDQRI